LVELKSEEDVSTNILNQKKKVEELLDG